MSESIEPQWGKEPIDLGERSLPALKLRYLLERLPERGRVLEFGSGEGKVLRTLAQNRPGLELVGCDARQPLAGPPGYTFRHMTEGIPARDAEFDAVVVADALEHVPDPARALGEIHRVLAPGGRFVGFVPIEGERWSVYELFRRLLGPDLYQRTKHHVQSYTFDGLRGLLESRFFILDWRYAYHALGHVMDASFFAATSLERLNRFWWQENRYYNAGGGPGAFARIANRMLEAGNRLAHFESSCLGHFRTGAAGVLFRAQPRPLDAGGPPHFRS